MQVREKVEKSQFTVVFPMICGSGGSKSGGCGAIWPDESEENPRRCGAKHISKSKCTNTPGSDHFWKLRCSKSAHRCGTKQMSKSKCTKHHMLGPLEGSDVVLQQNVRVF